MILGAEFPLEVGKAVVMPMTCDREGRVHHNMPMFVLREATFEEWQEFCRRQGVPEHKLYECLGPRGIPCEQFYEVSMD